MSLEIVNPLAKGAHLNVVLYGPPKVGKTVAAASAPGPILYLNTDGPNALGFARRHFGSEKILEVEVKGKDSLAGALDVLRDGGKVAGQQIQTVVLDSVGEAYRILLEEMTRGRPNIGQYGDAATMIERWCRHVRNLQVNLVLVAHEQLMETPEGNILMPQTGARKLPQILCAMVDVIAYCQMQPAQGEKKAVFWAQTVSGYGRYAGNRDGFLGETAFTNLDVWVAAWNGSTPESKATKPANEEAS